MPVHPRLFLMTDLETSVQTAAECAESVLEDLGPGLSECIYQRALCEELRTRGAQVESEVILPIRYGMHFCGFIRADVIVDSHLCLELKAKAGLTSADQVQAGTYLRHCETLETCVLMNFGSELTIKRVTRD